LWALVFSLVHLLWAAGWYVGLDPVSAQQAFAQPWFLAYDLAVAGLCLAAAVAALGWVRSWGRRVPHPILLRLLVIGTGVLVLRAGGGIVQGIYRAATGREVLERSLVWEVWFCLGAVLFALSLRRFRRASSAASRWLVRGDR
jgi:hypothetical protein